MSYAYLYTKQMITSLLPREIAGHPRYKAHNEEGVVRFKILSPSTGTIFTDFFTTTTTNKHKDSLMVVHPKTWNGGICPVELYNSMIPQYRTPKGIHPSRQMKHNKICFIKTLDGEIYHLSLAFFTYKKLVKVIHQGLEKGCQLDDLVFQMRWKASGNYDISRMEHEKGLTNSIRLYSFICYWKGKRGANKIDEFGIDAENDIKAHTINEEYYPVEKTPQKKPRKPKNLEGPIRPGKDFIPQRRYPSPDYVFEKLRDFITEDTLAYLNVCDYSFRLGHKASLMPLEQLEHFAGDYQYKDKVVDEKYDLDDFDEFVLIEKNTDEMMKEYFRKLGANQ